MNNMNRSKKSFSHKPAWAQNPTPTIAVNPPTLSSEEISQKLSAQRERQQHKWSKPAWASQGSSSTSKYYGDDDDDVDRSPVKSPVLKTTSVGEAMAAQEKAKEADLEALQRRLAEARQKAAGMGIASGEQPAEDPTANMTPEEKAKYQAEERLKALRLEVKEKENEAWKAHEKERLAAAKARQEEAKRQAMLLQKQREAADAEKIRKHQQQRMEKEKQEQLERERQQQIEREQAAAEAAAAEQQKAVAAEQQKAAAELALQQQVAQLQYEIDVIQAKQQGKPVPPLPAILQQPQSPQQQSKSQQQSLTPPMSPSKIAQETTPVRASEYKSHKWEKPKWALPDEDVQSDQAVLTDSIVQKSPLKAPADGYVPQVKEGADVKFDKGVFKKPAAENVKPRLVWIVVNVNGIKLGKIVMHLYGNVDAIVEKFFELKGLEIKRNTSTNNKTLMVDDIQPNFIITPGKGKTRSLGLTTTGPVHGVVQEGQDIVDKIFAAGNDSFISIKQSHIYPVKKSKQAYT